MSAEAEKADLDARIETRSTEVLSANGFAHNASTFAATLVGASSPGTQNQDTSPAVSYELVSCFEFRGTQAA